MQHDQVKFVEHLAVKSPLALEEFCAVAQRALALPDFEYDAENETEWAASFKGGIEYNISRPYKARTLRTWDSTVPEGCNFGVSLTFPKDAPETAETSLALVRSVGVSLANALGASVFYHRTWLCPGQNLPRSAVFSPRAR